MNDLLRDRQLLHCHDDGGCCDDMKAGRGDGGGDGDYADSSRCLM